jgi:hypothetical protein
VVLASQRGVRKGAVFVFGWLLSLAVVIAPTVLATGDKPPEPTTAPSTAVLAVKLAIGAGLLLIALRQRRRMDRPKKPKKPPKWQAGIDKMSPWYAVVIAAIVQLWSLVAAATAIIVEAKLSSAATYISLFLFCLIATPPAWRPIRWSTGTTRGPAQTGCAARKAPSRRARSGTSRRSPAPGAGRGAAGVREDAQLRQPPGPVCRADQRHRTARELPQALTHLALISAAFNLDRALGA